MSVQIINADAKAEGIRKRVFNSAAIRPSGIVNVACTQPTICVWKGSGNSCTADNQMSIRSQQVAIRYEKHGTNQVAEHVETMSTAEDVRGTPVTKVQFCSKALGGIKGNANVHSDQCGTV